MRLRYLLATITVTVFAAACGNNSTKDSTGSDTSTGNNTATVPEVVTPTIQVPEPVQASFKEKYPTATRVTWNRYEPVSTIDWEWSGWPAMDTTDYVAQFNWDGTDYW